MRRCKGKTNVYNFENRKWEELKFELGYFHQWSMSYEEFGDVGIGSYPIAIVELPDGKIITPCADNIQFLDEMENI